MKESMSQVIQADCRDAMREMPPASVDSIVTDPPYGLSFMGKGWDHGVPGVEFWTEALRVLKPGGHLLAFGGTVHRLTCAIEDAGFEIRDTVMWIYGSGFPKSLNVSKAMDKAAGAEREVVGHNPTFRANTRENGTQGFRDRRIESAITAPATDAAKKWAGFGTALKPAHEPIIVARKPLIGTVAANVQRFGTGAINIDGCRVEGVMYNPLHHKFKGTGFHGNYGEGFETDVSKGRWPANVIHDGSEEVLAGFPDSSAGKANQSLRRHPGGGTIYGECDGGQAKVGHADSGSAARFFYSAKASKADRGEGNTHPTVKPQALMRYLCRLVTPPGGTVLDPFAGSGSTGKAAIMEGFAFVGIEREPEYAEIARRRIAELVV